MTEVNGGKTYSQTSGDARALQAQLAAAKPPTRPLQRRSPCSNRSTTLNGKVDTLFRGETLRGLLLTSYGFSIFGDRAQQAAWVSFAAAFVLFLASIAGFVHAFTTKKDKAIAPVGPTDRALVDA